MKTRERRAQYKLRLLKAAEVIRKVPRKEFDMDFWGASVTNGGCGTTACIAGHCSLNPWFKRNGFAGMKRRVSVDTAIGDFTLSLLRRLKIYSKLNAGKKIRIYAFEPPRPHRQWSSAVRKYFGKENEFLFYPHKLGCYAYNNRLQYRTPAQVAKVIEHWVRQRYYDC